MGRRKNRKHGSPWNHHRKSSGKKDAPSKDVTNNGTKATEVPENSEGLNANQRNRFFACSESSMGESFDSAGADFVMIDCPGKSTTIPGNVETSSTSSIEGDLSLEYDKESSSLSFVETNESMRGDYFTEISDTVNAEKLPITIDSEGRKMLVHSLSHSTVVVESLSSEPCCHTESNFALCVTSSEGMEVTPYESGIIPQICVQNFDSVMEVNESDLPQNITSSSIEDNVPKLEQIALDLINEKASGEEYFLEDRVENSRTEMPQELLEETEFQNLGVLPSLVTTQFSQKSEDAESLQHLSLHQLSDNIVPDVVGSKTHLGKDLSSVELNDHCVNKSGKTFQYEHNIPHHKINEQISFKSAPLSSVVVKSTLLVDGAHIPQNETDIPETEDLEIELPKNLRVNENVGQREIEDVDISNEDDQCFESRNIKIYPDEMKYSSESEDNSLHVNSSTIETNLEQNDITDTPNEEQCLQIKSGSTEDLASGQNTSNEASGNSALELSKLRLNENVDQGEIGDVDMSNEDDQCFQSRNVKIYPDEMKYSCSESEDNSSIPQTNSSTPETNLEQNEITDTSNEDQCLQINTSNEDQCLQINTSNEDQCSQIKSDSTEDLTSGQNTSNEASGNSTLESSLLPNYDYVKKESEKQFHEYASQFPEKIKNKTAEKEITPKEIVSIFQERNSLEILYENVIGRNSPMGEISTTSTCDKPMKEFCTESKCTFVELVPSGDTPLQDEKEQSSEESTKKEHQNEILGTNYDQPFQKTNSKTEKRTVVEQSPMNSTENKAESVQSSFHMPSQESLEVHLDEVEGSQNEENPKQMDAAKPGGPSNNKSLNPQNAENAIVSPRKIYSSPAISFILYYNLWKTETMGTMTSFEFLQYTVTLCEKLINRCKSKLIKLSLRNKLKKERTSWLERITGTVGSVISNYSLFCISLVHMLIIMIARVKLLLMMNINLKLKKQMCSRSPYPLGEGNSIKECIKLVSRTTMCGTVSNVIAKINAEKLQQGKETNGNSSVVGIIYSLCDIVENLMSDETSSEIVKTLRDFLTDNQCIVEAYLAVSNIFYSSRDLFKTFIWNVVTSKGPDTQTKITNFSLIMQDYEHQNALHKQMEGDKIQSSIISQIKRARDAVQEEVDEINVAVKDIWNL